MDTTNKKIGSDSSSWYVIYVPGKREKIIKGMLGEMGISYFQPMQNIIRQWKCHKVKVSVPIISRCIFVNLLSVDEIENNVAIKEVAFLLKKKEGYITIGNSEIEKICTLLDKGEEFAGQIYALMLSHLELGE